MDDRSTRRADAVELSTLPILLYDGVCGFCADSVRFILRHERRQTLRFAALQSPAGVAIRARHPELANADSMIWVDPAPDASGERVFVRSDAALKIASYMGGLWPLASSARILPRVVRDAVYNLIARHRHRLGASFQQCVLPSTAARQRFID